MTARLTEPQERLLDRIVMHCGHRSDGLRQNGRARRTIVALREAGFVDYEFELVPHADGRFTELFRVTPTADGRAYARDGWPIHQPIAPSAPIPGRHWYGGCNPDTPRVRPDGVCEDCGDHACPVCGCGFYGPGDTGCQCDSRRGPTGRCI
jgi:hypothetical protein